MRTIDIRKVGKQLDKWVRKAVSGRDAAVCTTRQDEETPDGDDLYAALRVLPSAEIDDARMLVLCREQVEGRGEDSCLAIRDGARVFMGVFDGCGGSGAKAYAAFGGHTGAWAASRAATRAAQAWFARDDGGALGDEIDLALKECKALEPEGQLLMGSLSREFPTTIAAFAMADGDNGATFYWCGDSRCYVLDSDGLHQVTADDAAIQDAMRNLREDAPMTNVACASRPFTLHSVELKLEKPALVVAATDGCFGYLPSPMAFERLLLQTLARSSNAKEWRHKLNGRISEVSGDDYTLVAWPHGISGFKQMKRALGHRLAFLNKHYPAIASEKALFEQWRAYRKDYERMLQGANPDSERGGT